AHAVVRHSSEVGVLSLLLDAELTVRVELERAKDGERSLVVGVLEGSLAAREVVLVGGATRSQRRQKSERASGSKGSAHRPEGITQVRARSREKRARKTAPAPACWARLPGRGAGWALLSTAPTCALVARPTCRPGASLRASAT